ncbi:MAG: glycosyltransferase family 2 protein [Bdellovibrionales bacterium]|nr:glycosyltransferase family 2 protein [Bdellovibrionales bacterium]
MSLKIPEISIVVPIYNEAESIKKLHSEIADVCVAENYVFEIIFVDDGSRDNTSETVKSLKPIKYIQFKKNFGQTAAIDAGIKAAQYEYIVTMDGDGQNDPKDIPNLLEYIRGNDVDAVSGWRKNRKDPFLKKIVSRGANFLRGLLIKDGIHDSGCSLKIYKKECFDQINLFGEMHRFIPALLKIKGFRIGEIIVNHRHRDAGQTKYNWKRTIKGFLDMISVWFWNKYAGRPLHLLGGLGVVLFIAGILTTIVGIYFSLVGNDLFKNILPLIAVSLYLSSLQLFIFGLISDVILKNYYATTKQTQYTIRNVFKTNID